MCFFLFSQTSQAGFFDWFGKNKSQESTNTATVASLKTKQYTLSISKQGSGIVTSDDGKINCGKQCRASYSAKSKIVLKAEAGENYKFERWNGCDKISDGKCQTTLNKSKLVVAKFASKKPSLSQKSSSSSIGKTNPSKSSAVSSKTASSKSFSVSKSSSSVSRSSKPSDNYSQASSSKSSSSTPILIPITKNGFILSGTFCIVDYTLVPQSEINARRLLNLCEIDIPKLEAKFGRGPKAPPYKIQFYTPRVGASGNSAARAYASNGTVILSTNFSTDSWQVEFPWDAEMVLAHELTHVIQSFKYYYPGWLVEALADYGVYVAGYSKDLEKNCYHFSNARKINVFNCTYKFLKFVERKYDPGISLKLHRAFQSESASDNQIYSDNLFVQYTGKTYSQLISECSQDLDCGGVDPL